MNFVKGYAGRLIKQGTADIEFCGRGKTKRTVHRLPETGEQSQIINRRT